MQLPDIDQPNELTDVQEDELRLLLEVCHTYLDHTDDELSCPWKRCFERARKFI